MGRTDRASRVIAAPPAIVYGALLDRDSLEAWLPPDGMRGTIERWDPRPGGGFRMVLTYLDPTDDPGSDRLGTRSAMRPGPSHACRRDGGVPCCWSAGHRRLR